MFELIRIALKNVGKRKKRAALTMLGVFIGIAAVVALVSLGQGLQNTLNDQFEKVGADKIIIQSKDPTMIGERVSNPMTDRERDITDKVHGVKLTTGILFRGAKATFNNVQRTLYVMSSPEKRDEVALAYEFTTWELEDGRPITHKDKGKVAVGYRIWTKELFKRNPVIGNKLEIEGEMFEIVGTFQRTGDPGMDNGLLMAESDIRRIMDVPDSFNYLVAQSVAGENPNDVAKRIEKALRRDRHQDEGKEDFTVQSASDLIASFLAVFTIVQAVFVGIAAISLLVGGVGIMNTMYTAVLERTKEIGVMKAIGARNGDVMFLFLIESGFLGLAGGIIGVLIGAAISKSVSLAANAAIGPNTLNAAFPPWLIIGALVFSVLVGALSGIFPARRASKLSPVEALRAE